MKLALWFVGFLSLLQGAPASAQAPLASEILAVHNNYWAAAHVPPVVWDERLALGAQQWAWTLARNSRFEHSPRALRDDAGENLWIGTAGAFSAAAMVNEWGEERRDFRAGVYPDVSRTGHFETVAHYTQMVWRDTRRVGCGLARAPGSDILVCRYSAPGNVIGQAAY